jgi:hypothetical protein
MRAAAGKVFFLKCSPDVRLLKHCAAADAFNMDFPKIEVSALGWAYMASEHLKLAARSSGSEAQKHSRKARLYLQRAIVQLERPAANGHVNVTMPGGAPIGLR